MFPTGVNLLTFTLRGAVFFVLGTGISFEISTDFGTTVLRI